MKKILVIIMAMAGLLALPEPKIYSMEVIAGAKFWYVNWVPWLRDVGQTTGDRYYGYQEMKSGDGFMYGGSGSLRITDDITLSVSYLYGVLEAGFDHQDRGDVNGEDLYFRQIGNAKIKRHDIDSALGYSVLSWLKIFVGYKYQPLKLNIEQEGAEKKYSPGPVSQRYNITSQKVELVNHCPAIGVGVSSPLSDIFIFNMNISALYLKGSMDYSLYRVSFDNADFDNPSSPIIGHGEMDITGWGCNLEPSIVTAIGDNILLVLGFRYQVIVIKGDYRDDSGFENTYTDMKDHVYGVYLNALYRFK